MYRHLDTLNTEGYKMIIWKSSLVWSMAVTGNHSIDLLIGTPNKDDLPSTFIVNMRNTKIREVPQISEQP